MKTRLTTNQLAVEPVKVDVDRIIELAEHRHLPPERLLVSYRGEAVGWLNTQTLQLTVLAEPWRKGSAR